MKKSLQKPENWQDFESLCKKLWGEVWVCNEIKKNGRQGQKQHGVDVYGIPHGEDQYYGIQCKGKDHYTHAQLSKSEIDKEIELAKTFNPKLKKFYFATTANKDANIEEYVRLRDLQNRNEGNFEIHLFCWEDLVDLIEENKQTFDWYVKNINHKTIYSVKISFQDDSQESSYSPILLKNSISYKFKLPEVDTFSTVGGLFASSNNGFNYDHHLEASTECQPKRYYLNGMSTNKSSSVFSIKIKNDGNSQIENFKLYFDLIGDCCKFERVRKQTRFLDDYEYKYETYIDTETNKGVFEPQEKVLVQKDSLQSDEICIRPLVEEPIQVQIKWQLVSKDFSDEGVLAINLNTRIVEKNSIRETGRISTDEILLENYRGDQEPTTNTQR